VFAGEEGRAGGFAGEDVGETVEPSLGEKVPAQGGFDEEALQAEGGEELFPRPRKLDQLGCAGGAGTEAEVEEDPDERDGGEALEGGEGEVLGEADEDF
jgi:hypothetical protein